MFPQKLLEMDLHLAKSSPKPVFIPLEDFDPLVTLLVEGLQLLDPLSVGPQVAVHDFVSLVNGDSVGTFLRTQKNTIIYKSFSKILIHKLIY